MPERRSIFGVLTAPAERTTSARAKYLIPSSVSIPTALSGSSAENNTRATLVLVRTCRLDGLLERREEDVVRAPLYAVLGKMERPRGFPELTSGLRGYCVIY